MAYAILLFAICFFVDNAVSELKITEKQEASLNNYIDQILSNLHIVGGEIGVEPLFLPNQTKEFEHKIWFTTIRGVFSLNDGLLTNLSSIVRSKDVTLTYEDRVLVVEGEFEFPQLKIDYNFITQMNDYGPKGKLHGILKSLHIYGKLKINTENFSVKIDKLEFPKPGEISFTVDVSYIFNFFVNTLSEIITTVFKIPMIFIIEHVIKDTIQNKMNSLLENQYYTYLLKSVVPV